MRQLEICRETQVREVNEMAAGMSMNMNTAAGSAPGYSVPAAGMEREEQNDIRVLNELFLSFAREEARDNPDTAALRLGLDRDTVRLLSRIPLSALRRMALPDTLMFAPRSAGAFSELLRSNSVADRVTYEIRCLEE